MSNVQLTDSQELSTNTPPPPQPASWNQLADWLSRPVLTFSFWLSRQGDPGYLPVLESTRTVYVAMWQKVCHWLAQEGIALGDFSAADLSRFLDTQTFNVRRGRSGAISVEKNKAMKKIQKTEGGEIPESLPAEKKEAKEHRQRYVRMVEKIYNHLSELGLTNAENPGRKAAQASVGKGRNAPMRFLTPLERSDLLIVLQEVFKWPIPEEEKEKEKAKWTKVRDACLVAMVVGAGLKLSEVDSLSVNCTSDGFLHVPPKGVRLKRRCPVLPIASAGLSRWKEWITALPSLSTAVLFPADVIRRRYDQAKPSEAMHPATLFRRISALLKEAGIDGNRVGAQTLRNTYAAMLFEEGYSDKDMRDYLGIKLPENVIFMRQQHAAWYAKYGKG